MAEAKNLELSRMIQNLRSELIKAQEEGADQPIRFDVEDVELELDIAVEEDLEGGISAKFYVLTSHFKAKKKDAVTQKLKLKLKPVEADPDNPDKKKPATISTRRKD